MNKLASAIGAALAFSAASAFAADLPSHKAPPPVYVPPPPMWTGFYVGLNAGYGWGATTNAATAAGPAQEIQTFLHSLFQALKADGLGSSASTTGSTAAQSATGAVHYQGGLVSSLQTLIQQLGSSGTSTPATATLNASFNSLMQGVNGNAATAGSSAASTQTSNAALQNFLSNLLQSVQSSGAHSLSSVGANVNTNV